MGENPNQTGLDSDKFRFKTLKVDFDHSHVRWTLGPGGLQAPVSEPPHVTKHLHVVVFIGSESWVSGLRVDGGALSFHAACPQSFPGKNDKNWF